MTNTRPGSGPQGGESFRARMGSGWIHRAFAFITVFGFFSYPSQMLFLQGQTAEYPAKLAFLYNFVKFIEWPTSSYDHPGAPLVMCIVGADPFSADRESQLQGQTVAGHPVHVQRMKSNDQLSGCHVVYIPGTERIQQERLLRGLLGSSILTVGESEGFAELGGIINLRFEGDQLRFEINRRAAERGRLKISSHLLHLAQIID